MNEFNFGGITMRALMRCQTSKRVGAYLDKYVKLNTVFVSLRCNFLHSGKKKISSYLKQMRFQKRE